MCEISYRAEIFRLRLLKLVETYVMLLKGLNCRSGMVSTAYWDFAVCLLAALFSVGGTEQTVSRYFSGRREA